MERYSEDYHQKVQHFVKMCFHGVFKGDESFLESLGTQT